jgi:hypothetical protein
MTVRRPWLATIHSVAIIALFVGVCGWSAVVLAQAKRKVIRLEAIKVEGRIQKPQAFYILQRSNLNFEGLELKQSFIPKIVDSVENDPF